MTTPEPLTPAMQDYLKAIFGLEEAGEAVTTTALAERLRIAPASVTHMLQKLATSQPALVAYTKHQGAALTGEGRRAALKVIRLHRLLETYLVRALGFTWDEVHEEAERLEHYISDHLGEHLSDALGDPREDPHGHPIPSAALELASGDGLPLSGMAAGRRARVRWIASEAPDLLRYLAELGLVPGGELEVLEVVPFDQTVRLRVPGREPVVLGPALTGQVWVEEATAP